MGSRKIRVAQTGLAGMNGVLYANITNNLSNFNGRNGMGALMGSKNVRAVAALGSQKLEFADPDYLRQTAKEYARTFRDSPAGEALHVYGTTAFPEILSAAGALPVNNFRRSALAEAALIGGDTYNEILLDKRKDAMRVRFDANAESHWMTPNTASIRATADPNMRPSRRWGATSTSQI